MMPFVFELRVSLFKHATKSLLGVQLTAKAAQDAVIRYIVLEF